MNILDPTTIADESNYTKEDIRDLYVRRFKKDVLADLRQHRGKRKIRLRFVVRESPPKLDPRPTFPIISLASYLLNFG